MKRSVLAVLVLLIFGTLSLAADLSPGKGKFEKDLGLNAEQTKQLQEHRQQDQKQVKKLREELQTQHKELAKAIGQKSIDQVKIKKIATEIKAVQSKLVDQRVASMLELRKILNEEQFAKMQNMQKRMLDKNAKDKGLHRNKGLFR